MAGELDYQANQKGKSLLIWHFTFLMKDLLDLRGHFRSLIDRFFFNGLLFQLSKLYLMTFERVL